MAEQQQAGQLALVLGDLYIPQRCSEIPPKYKEKIRPNKVNAVFCTGNVGSKQPYAWLKSLSTSFHIVKGDYQEESFSDLQQQKVIQFADCKVGLIHGHQVIPWGDQEALFNKAKKMGVNILISGHTHEMGVSEYNGVYLINPGSMTGSYSSLNFDSLPTFMILQFKSNQIAIYVYSLSEGELNCVDTRIKRS